VSDIPEFGYIVRERAGISFKCGDPVSLSRVMNDMVASNERQDMGLRGRHLVNDFTWDRIANIYEDFLITLFMRS
jgi:glycosyltransferase involved in cell wall biosynthesis